MPLSSYCKKCDRDMPVGPFCPTCGAKLPAGAVRLAWCIDHTPVRDWMCWNAVMRIAAPVMAVTLLVTLAAEGLMGGAAGVERMLTGGITVMLLGVMGILLALLLLVLILQGDDLLDCVMDSRGVHIQTYLPSPTPLRLMLRFKSPRLMAEMGEEELLLISQKEILWKDVQRVQLWPEKNMILLYAPRWWMRVCIPCSPFTWEDALGLIRDKLGKKKKVILPAECRQAAPARSKPRGRTREQQLTVEDIPPQELTGPEEWQEESGDFTPLADVLEEIRQNDPPQ